MKITLLQTNLFWEQPEANLAEFSSRLLQVQADSNMVVLPEMFATGFTMQPQKYAARQGGPELQWMAAEANRLNMVICGSLAMHHQGAFYNRFVWMPPGGQVQFYDKRHLFSMGDENQHYRQGTEPLIVQYMGWRIRIVVCYDLRFPAWCRNRGDYDLLLVVANWPAIRNYAWQHLLVARAIENQCYVAAVNRVGTDGNGVLHSGDSCFISPHGMVLWQASDGEQTMHTVEPDMDSLIQFRRQFPVLADADGFTLE